MSFFWRFLSLIFFSRVTDQLPPVTTNHTFLLYNFYSSLVDFYLSLHLLHLDCRWLADMSNVELGTGRSLFFMFTNELQALIPRFKILCKVFEFCLTSHKLGFARFFGTSLWNVKGLYSKSGYLSLKSLMMYLLENCLINFSVSLP